MLHEKGISLEDEYKKNTGITPEDIRRLREWLNTQPHLPKDFITDLDLILIYLASGNSIQVAKELLDLNYTLRTHFCGIFKDRTVDNTVERVLNNVLYTLLPGQAKDGSSIFYGRLTDLVPKNFEFTPFIKAFFMVVDLWQWQLGSWQGFVLVFDMSGITLGHLSRLELLTLQQALLYVQDAIPLNMRSIHLINAPNFMDKLMAMIKPFMKNELLDLLVVHQIGTNTLEQYIPITLLPKEAGGDTGSVVDIKGGITKFEPVYLDVLSSIEKVLQNVRANKEFFVQESKKRVVESLRPGKPKTITDIFGSIEGSFKKLDID